MSSQPEHHERALHHQQPKRPKVWTVDHTTAGFEFPGETNPLSTGVWCEPCNVRLSDHGGDYVKPCPLCGYVVPPKEESA